MVGIVREIPVESPEFESLWRLRVQVLLDPFSIDHELARVDDSKSRHFGLFEERGCAACLFLVPRDDGIVQMRQMAVRPALQRQGLGTRLLRHAEDAAFQSGSRKVVAHARLTALPFYEAISYRAVGEIFQQVGLPHRRVEKELWLPE